MKSTLFKLTALAGVMGAGFLVVYQAQQELTQSSAQNEGSQTEENLSAEQPEDEIFRSPDDLASTSENRSHEVSPSTNDSTPPAQSEPTPTAGVPGESDIDPFGDTPQREVAQTEPEPTSVEEDSTNPFASLLQSRSDTVEANTAGTDATEARESEFNSTGFASIDDQSARPHVQSADIDPFGAGINEPPISPPSDATSEALSASEAAQVPPALDLPEQTDPSGLTALDSESESPQLIPPPVDATPADQDADGQSSLQALETSNDADETMLPENAIAQLGAEQSPAERHSLNPFLAFPEDRAETQQPRRESTPPVEQRQPQVEPNPFADTPASPQPEPQRVFPDGSIEMTIPQREDARSANDSASPFDPFGGPETSRQPEQPARLNQQQPKVDHAVQPASGELFPLFEDDPEPVQPTTEENPLPAQDFAPQLDDAPKEDPPSFDNPPLLNNLQPSNTLPAFNDAPEIERTPELEPPPTDNRATLPQRPNVFEGIGTVTADAPTGSRQAQVTIEKIAQSEAVVNKPMIYSIKVRNVGQSPAENVVVKDMVPKGSRLEGSDPQALLDEQDQKLVWRVKTLAPGQEYLIRVKVTPTEARQIGSVATVTFEAAVAARTKITAPDLKLAVAGLSEVRVGEKASYKFTITNVGTADATGVFVRNLIPPGFQHPRGDDLEYDVGTLPKGQSKDVMLTLLAVAPGQFDNTAILGAEGDIEVQAKKSVSILTSRLKVHRQGPANRFVGREALFTNTIINESSEPVRNITVQETVPKGVEFTDASDGGRFDPQTRTITWNLPGLRPGDKRQLQSKVKPTAEGEWPTTVKAFDQRQDVAEATSQLMVAGFSSLTINVSHAGRPVTVGEEVALRLTIRNRGTAAANDVKAVVQIPPEMRFVDAKGPVKHRELPNNEIEFQALNTLEVNGEQQFDIVLSAAHQGRDARVNVKLTAAELTTPLNKDEQVVILSENE